MKVDYHPHLLARMEQRGITPQEVEQTLYAGWAASDAKPGTQGKTYVFQCEGQWLGRLFEEKEVTVYYKMKDEVVMVLTAIARYGSGFARR